MTDEIEALAEKLHPIFCDAEMKRKIVRGLVEEVLIGGRPYTVEIKFRSVQRPVIVRFDKAAPYKRANHYRYAKFEIVM